jgi:hypothetical protein
MSKSTFTFLHEDPPSPSPLVMKDGFTVQEASAATGCTAPALQNWSGPAKAITPAVAHPQRVRTPKLFDWNNLVQIRVLTILSERRVEQAAWHALRQTIPPECWDPTSAHPAEVLLLTDGTDWHYLHGKEADVQRRSGQLLTSHQDALSVNLAHVKRELRDKLA